MPSQTTFSSANPGSETTCVSTGPEAGHLVGRGMRLSESPNLRSMTEGPRAAATPDLSVSGLDTTERDEIDFAGHPDIAADALRLARAG